jgi:Peptidase inhibitor I78 family
MSNFANYNLYVSVFAVSGAAMLLAGCQTYGERIMAQAKRQDTCGAKRVLEFVGQKANQPTREAIERSASKAQEVRWMAPGDEILANLSTGRMSILLNKIGTILSIGCY